MFKVHHISGGFDFTVQITDEDVANDFWDYVFLGYGEMSDKPKMVELANRWNDIDYNIDNTDNELTGIFTVNRKMFNEMIDILHSII